MTFDEIVSAVCVDLNISAQDSIDRVGRHVNLRYRFVLSEIGMNDFSRVSFEADLEPGTRDQEVASDNDPVIERVVAIWRQPDTDPPDPEAQWVPMGQVTWEEILSEVPRSNDATKWAKKRVGALSTQFRINSDIPDGQTVLIEGEEHSSELSGDDVPAFPESFHNILVNGAKCDELRKMEKIVLADRLEGNPQENPAKPGTFFGDLARLKLKTALMAFGNIRQGEHSTFARRPWQRGRC